MAYELEFYATENNKQPAQQFIDKLNARKKRVLLAAIESVLIPQGIDVCKTEAGKNLGQGLYEFRVRDKEVVLRVYFHPHGNKLLLLLSGYDKGRSSAGRREQKAIAQARRYLKDYKTNPPA
jgi:putative component of toxin-antitoxin plasmid stabilization module